MPEAEEVIPLLAKPRNEVVFVANVTTFNAMVESLRNTEGSVAIDAERAAGFKYSNRAYLIQLHTRGDKIYLIDPIAIVQEDEAAFGRLQQTIAEREWIIHAATQDLPCLAELGLQPQRLFDTELAGRLAGLTRVGLGFACEALLKIKLAKEHSAVDWSTRPLKADWLNYAALDVDVLPDLRDAFVALLDKQTKTIWATQEFDHLLGFKPKAQDPDKWRGLSGLHLVKDRTQLAIARALWQARENLAIEKDVSPGRLLPDSSIVHAATQSYANLSALTADSQFIGRASRVYKQLWWDAIQSGKTTDDLPTASVRNEGIPNHRSWPTKFPEADRRLKVMRHFLNEHSVAHQLPIENMMHPEIVRKLAWHDCPTTEVAVHVATTEFGARPWQADLCSAVLLEALRAAADPDFELPDPQTVS